MNDLTCLQDKVFLQAIHLVLVNDQNKVLLWWTICLVARLCNALWSFGSGSMIERNDGWGQSLIASKHLTMICSPELTEIPYMLITSTILPPARNRKFEPSTTSGTIGVFPPVEFLDFCSLTSKSGQRIREVYRIAQDSCDMTLAKTR